MNLAETTSLLAIPFATGCAVLLTHVPLGQAVLKRGIVFVDLAVAQVAGVGVLVGHMLGLEGDLAQQAAAFGPALALAALPGFEAVTEIVQTRCSMCHAAEPLWDGMLWPPKGVVLETPAQIAAEGRRIYLQAGGSHAMPPANLRAMEPAERAAIVRWYRAAGHGGSEG
jgi:uncharacterized membrane protein